MPPLFTRWVLVLACALATPALQDAVCDTVAWVTGSDCCSDPCEEAAQDCTSHCAHCSASTLVALLPTPVLMPAKSQRHEPGRLATSSGLRSGHHEPPLRPPVS